MNIRKIMFDGQTDRQIKVAVKSLKKHQMQVSL